MLNKAKKRGQAVRGVRKQQEAVLWKERVIPVLASKWVAKSVFVLMLIVFTGWGYQQMSSFNMLPIESVQIEGEFNYLSQTDLQQRALPHVRGGFFSVDLLQVRKALIKLPWVEDVSIRRHWPNALRIRVIEKQPVAYWGENELLSSRAQLFKPGKVNKTMGLPKILGPEGQHKQMLKELGQMQAWLMDTGLIIQQVKQDARRSWTLYMSSGLELRLGREKTHERLHRFVDVFTQTLRQKKDQIRHLDMRYTNGFAIAWQHNGQGA
ncbi:MAG: cell division protein FtsQ/DivIB [Gammaproteobacteria bacterium]|nr:cell division protein FtsQ/DivIB [Gammaproteobacteria bacterium]